MHHRSLPLAIAACMIALPCWPGGSAPGFDGWARFDDATALAAARAIVASEAPGDASVSSLSVEEGHLTVQGVFGLDNGSRWATLGAEIAPTDPEAGADMSTASVLRIRLASAEPRPLRVRIKGADRDIGSAGCYPVVVQMVTAAPADYVIPLAAFRSPGWCGAKAVSIEQTLHAVARVEVTANDGPAGPVSFSVGRIDFVDDEVKAPDLPPLAGPAARAASIAATAGSAASLAAGPPHRRASAARPSLAASAASPRRVVCEHSARYELTLCY
jgi:hypothetical protein